MLHSPRTGRGILVKQVLFLLISTFLLSACIGGTEPIETAITFQTDAISCSGTAAIEITIDGENQGVFIFPSGGEWSFPVLAGVHSIKAEGEIPELGLILLERTVTVGDGENFVVVLTCST